MYMDLDYAFHNDFTLLSSMIEVLLGDVFVIFLVFVTLVYYVFHISFLHRLIYTVF